MKQRPDGSRYPDRAVDAQALEDFTDLGVETGQGFGYNVALGDLIVQALIGRDLIEGVTGHPADYESFEHAFLQRIALELRALNQAAATELTTDDHSSDNFTVAQTCEYIRGLARRVEAGAELASRLREARWGHPCFGGGEAFLAKQAEKLRNGRHS